MAKPVSLVADQDFAFFRENVVVIEPEFALRGRLVDYPLMMIGRSLTKGDLSLIEQFANFFPFGSHRN